MKKLFTLLSIALFSAVAFAQDLTYTITVPADADFALATKSKHYMPFSVVEPTATSTADGVKTITYSLIASQQYNYRTWKAGGLTQAGYFYMNADAKKCPTLSFTNADYSAFDPKTINHDVTSNNGYETGDILVNINERGHLKMNVGDTFDAHAMRSWQLTDNVIINYFMEPDFHYTVLDVNGNPSTGVIEVDNSLIDPWATIKAIGKGTAIVLVTYDAIGVNDYASGSASKTAYVGGQYWGAIWPENTAVYVVSVGDETNSIQPNMVINENNVETEKVAGKNVDAEHDIFYYLDTTEGAIYTFKPEGVAEVTMAYPTIGEQMATYKGFTSNGVTKNDDGSYTLLLKEGRQIVRLTDETGNAVYQVLTAKKCHREITNATRPGSKLFVPGDKVKVQYSGLRHPSNKLAAVYNMSAYIAYDGKLCVTPSPYGGANQYMFGSTTSAQAYEITIPDTTDVAAMPNYVLSKGNIEVFGYGDPIGNHRAIVKTEGLKANLNAVSHTTFMGSLPDISIPLSAAKNFTIKLESNVADVKYTITGSSAVTDNGDGTYSATYGSYKLTAAKAGYKCYRSSFAIGDDAEGDVVVKVDMQKADANAWDGTTKTKPEQKDDIYQIATGAELAWFADTVNVKKSASAKAVLTSDIDLADYDWTPIGYTNRITYKGTFDGQGHTVKGLYVNNASNYLGLFGYLNGGTIKGLTIDGNITGAKWVGGVVGFVTRKSTIDRCANKATVAATTSRAGGIIGQMSATATLTNCYNLGNISAPEEAGGILGYYVSKTKVENVFSTGEIQGTKNVGVCIGGANAKNNVKNAYALKMYTIDDSSTIVTDEQMRSGEVAYKLGDAFGQEIGVDEHPVLGGKKVYYDADTDTYYNKPEDVNSVNTIRIDSYPTGIYTLDGRRLSAPQRGVNIIRYADGSTRKVVVR